MGLKVEEHLWDSLLRSIFGSHGWGAPVGLMAGEHLLAFHPLSLGVILLERGAKRWSLLAISCFSNISFMIHTLWVPLGP